MQDIDLVGLTYDDAERLIADGTITKQDASEIFSGKYEDRVVERLVSRLDSLLPPTGTAEDIEFERVVAQALLAFLSGVVTVRGVNSILMAQDTYLRKCRIRLRRTRAPRI